MFLRALVLLWSLSLWGALAVNETPPGPFGLRLEDGDARCRGQLQVRVSGQDWVGVRAFGLTLRFLDRVCAELDCGSALAVGTKEVKLREAVFLDPERCKNSSLELCPDAETHHSKESLQLNCSDSVRLVSGRSLCSGSLQIRDQSRSWTSVCEGALGRRGAEVLCRELGCGAPLLQGALSPQGQTFHCEGHESALMDCPRNQTRTEPGTCPTLQLTCSEPLRLVGGPGRCEGTLEVQFRGQWRRVVPFGSWDLEDGAPVCGALGCGSAVSTGVGRGYNSSEEAWVVYTECAKRLAVRDCVRDGFPPRFEHGLELLCSG